MRQRWSTRKGVGAGDRDSKTQGRFNHCALEGS